MYLMVSFHTQRLFMPPSAPGGLGRCLQLIGLPPGIETSRRLRRLPELRFHSRQASRFFLDNRRRSSPPPYAGFSSRPADRTDRPEGPAVLQRRLQHWMSPL